MPYLDPELIVRVKSWRESAGLSQAGLAAKLGLKRGSYALCEQGRGCLGQKQIDLLLQLLGEKTAAPAAAAPAVATTPPAPKKKRAKPQKPQKASEIAAGLPARRLRAPAYQAVTTIMSAFANVSCPTQDEFIETLKLVIDGISE